MFKKTDTHPQLDMFMEPSLHMGKRTSTKYSDPEAWHNQFFRTITSKIDETIFEPLFKSGNMGAPNASIRILVVMSILKEGFGCSDEDLFEKCEFDLLTRRALGLVSLSDAAPSLDTYYLFRRRICAYQDKHSIDLMQKCFEQVAGEQVRMLKISGKCVRMDSKLIGSNIAKVSRYELIHRTLTKFLKHKDNLLILTGCLHEQAKAYLKEDPGKTVYRSNEVSLQDHILTLGEYIHTIIDLYSESANDLDLLKRVFDDQYQVDDGKVILCDKKTISANSLQSPDDPDASYRNKNGKETMGFVTNITETVEDGKPSIITSVQTETATKADCHMLQEAVENSERVTGNTVEDLYADGAYQSPDNRKYAEGHGGMKLKTGKMQGGGRWILIPHDNDGLTVIEKTTGNIYEAVKAVTKQGQRLRWRIPWTTKNGNAGWRYFEDKDIKAYQLRAEIESLPAEEQHRRNNVEAVMFQYSFHTRNGKTRYRGLLKHRLHAYARCLWMNLKRIIISLISSFQRAILYSIWSLQNLSKPYYRLFEIFEDLREIIKESLLRMRKSLEISYNQFNATY